MNRCRVVALILLLASQAGYFAMKMFPHEFLGLLAVYSAAFLCFGVLALCLKRGQNGPGHGPSMALSVVIIAGIVARLIVLFSPPVLENDFHRYLWDGRVLANGVNPYLYSPMDPALDFLDTDYREKIGWKKYGTIYPPLAQIVFAGSHLFFGDSLIGLKIIFLLFDLGTGFVLVRWLRSKEIDPSWSFLYFLNPLVLREIGNAAHLDSIPVFFSTLSLYLMSRTKNQKPLWAWISLALGVTSKLFPIVLAPLLVRVDPKWKQNASCFLGVVALMYLPFMGAGSGLFGGAGAYAQYWIWNASVFKILSLGSAWVGTNISTIFHSDWIKAAIERDAPAKLIVGIIFAIILFRIAKNLKKRIDLPVAAFWTLSALLILSPVMDGWYVLWILPLACLLRSKSWIAFSYLVVASYAWFYSKEIAPYFRIVEYALFFTLLYWEYFRLKRRSGVGLPI